MDLERYRSLVRRIAEDIVGVSFDEDASGVDAFWPILERMRLEGAVVVLKLDGERVGGGSLPYTAFVSGRVLGGEFFRTDARSVEEALSYIIVEYARSRWGFRE